MWAEEDEGAGCSKSGWLGDTEGEKVIGWCGDAAGEQVESVDNWQGIKTKELLGEAVILQEPSEIDGFLAGNLVSSKMTFLDRYTLCVVGSRQRYPFWLETWPMKIYGLLLKDNLWLA
jgi:hypothetical protein